METSPWSNDEVSLLLSVWGNASVQASLEGTYRNKSIYEKVAHKMGEGGFNRSWLQCQRKIKNVKTKYKEIKDANNRSGAGRITCPFYEELNSILGEKPSVCPLIVMDSAASEEEQPLAESEAGGDTSDDTSINVVDEEDTGDHLLNEAAKIDSAISASASTSTAASSSSSRTSLEHGQSENINNLTKTSRKRRSKMEATLDVFTKKMVEVLQHDNEVLIQMQAEQHAHEMKMMAYLTQLMSPKPQPVLNMPPPPLSNSQHPFPSGPQPYQHLLSNTSAFHLNPHAWHPQGPHMCPQDQPSFLRDLEETTLPQSHFGPDNN